jgi:hypothetical protein
VNLNGSLPGISGYCRGKAGTGPSRWAENANDQHRYLPRAPMVELHASPDLNFRLPVSSWWVSGLVVIGLSRHRGMGLKTTFMTRLRHQPPYFAAMHNRGCRNDVLG